MNRHIIDIFINGDFSEAYDGFRWNQDVLAEYAHELLVSLEALGVHPLPQINEVVDGFLDRVMATCET